MYESIYIIRKICNGILLQMKHISTLSHSRTMMEDKKLSSMQINSNNDIGRPRIKTYPNALSVLCAIYIAVSPYVSQLWLFCNATMNIGLVIINKLVIARYGLVYLETWHIFSICLWIFLTRIFAIWSCCSTHFPSRSIWCACTIEYLM